MASGTCGAQGDNLIWTLTTGGILTISGKGDMKDFPNGNTPWRKYKKDILILLEGVTSIGEKAFSDCTGFTSLGIPKGVTRIGEKAFSGCSRLYYVVIPGSVTSIGYGAFHNCSGLIFMIIPEGVESIEERAFYECSSLLAITIPQSVRNIGWGAFGQCPNLTSIEVAADNPCYSSQDGVLFNKGRMELLRYPEGKPGETYRIPDGVKHIEKHAFEDCSSLTSIVIPDGVAELEEGAFNYCPNLVSIEVAADNPCYSSQDGVLFNKDKTELLRYPKDKPDKTYRIPDGVKHIGEYAFDDCSSLTSIVIPDGVTELEEGAFDSCPNLVSIEVAADNPCYSSQDGVLFNKDKTELLRYPKDKPDETYRIPDGVKHIGEYAFDDCSSLTSIIIPDGVEHIGEYAFDNCSGLTSIIIPDGVTVLGEGAFRACSGLTSVVIPQSVTNIEQGVFWFDEQLTFIEVVADNPCYSSQDGVLFNKDKTELLCYPEGKPGETYRIPDGVKHIGEYAFYCANLTSIVIPKGVTSIGAFAFECCRGLTSIVIPAGVTSMGSWAFSECSSLTSVVIPEGVASIMMFTFLKCTNLTSITIPASVKSIEKWAFEGSGLTELIVRAVVPPVVEYDHFSRFSGVDKSIPVYVPAESIEAYRAAECWKENNFLPIEEREDGER